MLRNHVSAAVCLTILGVCLDVSQAQLVQYRPEITDLSGNVVSSIAIGEEFLFHLYVQDIRAQPQGVFAAFVNVTYDGALFGINGSIDHSSPYVNGISGDLSAPGLMGESGGVDGILPLGGDELLVFVIPMISTGNIGTATFGTGPTDDQVQHGTFLFGATSATDASDIAFLSTSLTVVPEPATHGMALLILVGLAAMRPRQ